MRYALSRTLFLLETASLLYLPVAQTQERQIGNLPYGRQAGHHVSAVSFVNCHELPPSASTT